MQQLVLVLSCKESCTCTDQLGSNAEEKLARGKPHPLILRPHPPNTPRYLLISGERRESGISTVFT